jgi:hypothetical protein
MAAARVIPWRVGDAVGVVVSQEILTPARARGACNMLRERKTSLAQYAWKAANASGTSWTIKGVQETTREAVREAAAEAEMVIGEWVDRALGDAARAALHPSPPPATVADIAAILKELAEFKASVLALAGARDRALADVQARVQRLAEVKADGHDLAQVQARVQKLAERGERYERPAVRHVMVEHKRPNRLSVQTRLPDKDPPDS